MTRNLTLSEIKLRLAVKARELGLSAFGISRAEGSEITRSRLLAAVDRGDLKTWGYDAQWAHGAADPRSQLAQAQAVICVALAYGHPAPRLGPLQGRISNYAWTSGDYHEILGDKLIALGAELAALTGSDASLIICDTKPLAERAQAVAAGIGWVGKHTNLIVPAVGSYVFLGEILTTIPLPPDPPRKTHCGSCARCVSSCPTGALRGDYTMDARLCISDLTQRRGSIPRAQRPLLGTWLWGCDLCQIVCPPTLLAKTQADAAFAPPSDAYPNLLELLHLTRVEFERRYRSSSLGWRGASVLRRNAAVVLGNLADRATVPALLRAFQSEGSAIVREHIAWALGRIDSPQAQAGAAAMLARESDARVRTELQLVCRL